MKSYIAFLFVFLFIQCTAQVLGQDLSSPDYFIERLYRQQQEADISYADFYETLYQFYQQPLDLNSCSPEELRMLYVLNDVQIAALEDHVLKYGPLVSVYELQSIEGFSIEIIRHLLPFVTVSQGDVSWRALKVDFQKANQHYLLLRTSFDTAPTQGYSSVRGKDPAYEGAPFNRYLRYRFLAYKKLSLGVTMENDAGERFRFDPAKQQFGADYLSFHAMVYDRGRIKRLVVGDYQLQFGQGLVLAGGFFLGKGSETVLGIRRGSTGIKPYTSLSEGGNLRGAALTIDLKRFEITPFISRKAIDATLYAQDSLEDDLASLKYTGLHRTQTELQGRHAVIETTGGINAGYLSPSKRFTTGVNMLFVLYDKQITTSSALYALHQFRGTENINFSAYYSYFWRNISLFGEAGSSKNGGKGIIQGAMLALSPKLDLSVLYRHYTPDLQTPYGNSFGENYKNANETGIYWGIKLKQSPRTEWAAFYDRFTFPWLKYQVSAPSGGHEYLVQMLHKFNKKTVISVQYRYEAKEKDMTDVSGEKILGLQKRNAAKIQLEIKTDPRLSFRSHIQCSDYASTAYSAGFLLSQEIGYESYRFDCSVSGALFDTDDFNNRQYAYERDVLHAVSFPFFSGKGMRQFLLVKYKISSHADVWLKFARTTYFDRMIIGSGNDQLQGNVQSELRLQVRYSF